jgi:tetratricopeptide (TPR) repeat protein
MSKASRRVPESRKSPAKSRFTTALPLLYAGGLFAACLYFFWPSTSRKIIEPHFVGLGNYSRKVTTASPAAQQYFDQGLIFVYGFNYDEAVRSFQAAAENDPGCAMAYWGIALANGPHINRLEVTAAQAHAACQALKKARDLASNATAVEQALIKALGTRYTDPEPADRKSLDRMYAAAMREVRLAYPEDADVGALGAEALIDLRPWDQWKRDGKEQPGTAEILEVLAKVLSRSPEHPLALHMLIHALETSPHPEQADSAADRLRDLVPGVDHLVHMPSHIDVRRGRWQQAVEANEKAVAVENAFWKTTTLRNAYSQARAHNRHMLAFAAMMQGQSSKADGAVQELISEIPESFLVAYSDKVDGFFSMPYEIHLRFGRWDAMLAEPPPRDVFPLTTALWHYARGVAYAAKKQVDAAKEEQRAFAKARKNVPENIHFRRTRAVELLGIAEKMLAGEILYREGRVNDAIGALQEAVRREDAMPYSEPPNWFLPVRHALGATLMDAGRFAEAEKVYRADLDRYPENGWSLFGLERSLQQQHKQPEALAVSARFERAWRQADIRLRSSCFCLPSTPD